MKAMTFNDIMESSYGLDLLIIIENPKKKVYGKKVPK
jgi:hypothetical protein